MTTATSRVAGSLNLAVGLGFGPLAICGARYFAQHGRVWQFAGFPTYGDGPFEAIGVPNSAALIAGFAVVCAVEMAIGAAMLTGRRPSPHLSVALLPFEWAYWLGFALPFGVVVGVMRAIALTASSRSTAAHRATEF